MSVSEKEFIPGVTEDVYVTDNAVKEAKKLIEQKNIPSNYGLRIGIKGGGCSGFTYKLGFDGKSRTTDIIIEKEGIKIFIDMKSYLYLIGTQIDFTDAEEGRGFVFKNPSVGLTCICNSSFGD
jgi:iron-sulfur cluster assembly protein